MKANTFPEVSCGSRGMTLLEMLVVIVLFAVVTLSVTIIFKNSLYRFSRQFSEKEIYSEAFRVLEYMGRYLPSAMCNDMEGGLRISFSGEGDHLRFVSPFSEGPESDLSKFSIYFDEDASAVKVSVVRVDRAAPDFYFPSGFPGAQTLGERIGSFILSYYSGSDWLDRWDTVEMSESSLPEMVRVELTVFSEKKIEGKRIEKTFIRLIGID